MILDMKKKLFRYYDSAGGVIPNAKKLFAKISAFYLKAVSLENAIDSHF